MVRSSVLIEKVLEEYTFAEILELNNLTEEDTLQFLVEQEFLILPVVL